MSEEKQESSPDGDTPNLEELRKKEGNFAIATGLGVAALGHISQAFPSRAGQESVKYESAQFLSGDGVLKHIEVDKNEQTRSLPAIGSRSRYKLEKYELGIGATAVTGAMSPLCYVIPPILIGTGIYHRSIKS